MKSLSMRFFPKLWSSTLFLLVSVCFGLIISLISNNMFMMWLGLEMKMFGVMPFVNKSPNQVNKTLFATSGEMKVSFFYFFVQVMGSLFFAWGSMVGDWYVMSLIGLMMKMGAAPFFWWVPSVVPRLDWFSMGIISTIQKMPGMMLLRLTFDMKMELCIVLSLLGFLISSVGMKFSYKNLKLLMAWSSMSNMSMLLILMVLKNKFGLIYYVFYSIMVLMFCLCMNLYKGSVMCSSISKGKKNSGNLLSSSLLLVFSGLPPFISFLLKLYFLGGLYSYDCLMQILDLLQNGGDMAYFSLRGSWLQSWKLVLVFMLMMVLQSVGYVKAFMSMNSFKSSRLSKSSQVLNHNSGNMLMVSLLVYFLSLMFMWI